MLAADGWQCHVVVPRPSPLEEEFRRAGASLHVIPMRRITTSGGISWYARYAASWPMTVFRLWRLVKRLDPAVIHSNSLHSWYGWAVAAAARRPHVWHAREIVVQSVAALRLERFLSRFFAWRVLCVSGAVAEQLDGRNVAVVHDVLTPEDRFSPALAGRFRAAVGIADDVPLVGAAGRIDTWKGFDVLLEAVPDLTGRRPELRVVVAGGPVPGKEDYEAALRGKAEATAGVRWLGERHDVPEMMADLDAFVLASTEPEPFASVLVEALASGVPVAATRHGGSPEMLAMTGDVSGLFAPRDPAALAKAVLEVLPDGPSSLERRRSRRPCVVGDAAELVDVFEDARLRGLPWPHRFEPSPRLPGGVASGLMPDGKQRPN